MSVIVCERRGTWAAALRHALSARGARLKLAECRTLDDCRSRMDAEPDSLFIVEAVEGASKEVCDFLYAANHGARRFSVIVVTSGGDAQSEQLLRELGALHVAASARRLGPVVDAILAHRSAAPQGSEPLSSQLWSRLPWKKSAERLAWTD